MSLQVLVVEDDPSVRDMMRQALSLEGFVVRTAVSLSEASSMVDHAPPDLMLLDLGLPDGDGAALLHHIRLRYNFPVLVVSARHQEAQKVQLLDAGADDYVVKPFSVPELLARIRVALRHRGTTVAAAVTRHTLDGLDIDLEARTVYLAGVEQRLTPTEFNLLARLVRSAGKVVTHRQLLWDVWGAEYVDHTHYLRLYMGQLRAKLERNPAEPRHLLTEVGVGYRLATA